MRRPLIALLTDFGERDHFAGSLKGVIASINPEATVVDVTHGIEPFDVAAGAFVLSACVPFFPEGAIFLAVVDPGVGGARRMILARTARHGFVGPDNGLLWPAIGEGRALLVRELADPRFFLAAGRSTFEARDKMAPAAAWLSLGVSPEEFGPPVADPVRLPVAAPLAGPGGIAGAIVYRDRFGNLVTNITARCVESLRAGAPGRPVALAAGRRTIRRFARSYSEGPAREPFLIVGSLGLLEIAVREGSAARRLGLAPGRRVVLKAAAKGR